jgi:16S rRNA (guanine966-N2)-methyltransferase
VLELFAGSGALGIEAWSRGAASVTWVEKDPRVFRFLQANVKTLCGVADGLRVVCSDALRFLEKAAPEAPWDLVLADPPYDREGRFDWLGNALRLIQTRPILSASGWVVFEQGAREAVNIVSGWSCIKDRRYGDTRLLTYAREPDGARTREAST